VSIWFMCLSLDGLSVFNNDFLHVSTWGILTPVHEPLLDSLVLVNGCEPEKSMMTITSCCDTLIHGSNRVGYCYTCAQTIFDGQHASQSFNSQVQARC
jgi:hypothetical protein